MQKVSLLGLVFLLMHTCSNLFAQEAFTPEQLYFQGEVIRKVSVGADGIWVIKGADSTGLARLDFQGVEKDYTASLGLNEPLTGIVGKYGDKALIVTKNQQAYWLDTQKPTQITHNNGLNASRIHHVYGSPGHTRMATDNGVFESFDNNNFHQVNGTAGAEYLFVKENSLHTIDVNKNLRFKYSPTIDGELFNTNDFHANWSTDFYLAPKHKIYAYETTNARDIFGTELMIGAEKGFYANSKIEVVGNTGSSKNRTYEYLKDTAIYSLKRYKHFMLIGSEHGLFYYRNNTYSPYNGTVTAVELGSSYIIYDIAVQEDLQIIWLATNKGLLQIKDEYKVIHHVINKNLLWAKSPNGSGREKANATLADPKGSLYQTGYFSEACEFGNNRLVAQNNKDFYLAKFNTAGEVMWVRTAENSTAFGTFSDEAGTKLASDSQGNIYVICHITNQNAASNYAFSNENVLSQLIGKKNVLLKYSPEGTLLKLIELADVEDINSLQISVDQLDNVYISGITDKTLTNGRFVLKLDSEGSQIWNKTYPSALDRFDIGYQGKFYLSGYFLRTLTVGSINFESESYGNLALIHFDDTGEPIWHTMIEDYSSYNSQYVREIQADKHGNTYVGGDTGGITKFGSFTFDHLLSDAYFLTKINVNGEFEWLRYSGGVAYTVGFKNLLVDSEDNIYITGEFSDTNVQFGNTILKRQIPGIINIYIAKFDSNGTNIWAQSLPNVRFDGYESIDKSIVKIDNGVIVAANLSASMRINNQLYERTGKSNILTVALSDTPIETPFTTITGRSFHDLNGNNLFDAGEAGISGNLIKAEPGSFYATTDYYGAYQLILGAGSYTIEQVIPKYATHTFTQTTPTEHHLVQVSDNSAVLEGYDFAHSKESIKHPEPEIVRLPANLTFDISSTTLRRCFPMTASVYIRNNGDDVAQAINVVVEIPEHIIVESSSYPWLQKAGNLLTFKIDNIPGRGIFHLNIRGTVRCDDESIRNLQQCVKASVNFNDPSKVDPNWDKSDIELAAACKDNGFVRLHMKNIGGGNMVDSASFSVFLDQQKVHTGRYKLAAAEELSLNLLANGKPLLFVAELSPLHPQKKSVSLRIEGCTTTAAPTISHSYESTLPADTLHENQKIVCLPITDSYDPNDKLAMPAGVTDNHNIVGNEFLTYTIRFQNTGTAPAINVRITDALDEQLDLNTLRIDGASHPVQWERQNRQLVWRFTNIYLPDSTTNEPGSHGFVKFRIKPKQGLPKGSIIRNKAAIFFDYNSPIETNEVFHTIGLPELIEEKELVVQNCNTSISLQEQEPDQHVVICDNDTYELSRNLPATGNGRWKVSKGQGTLADPNSSQTTISGLSYGENKISWIVTYCDQQVMSNVTIIREQPLAQPVVAQPAPLCQGDAMPTLTASAQSANIEWYADAALTQRLGQGLSYQPLELRSQTFYVVQRSNNCLSQATPVHFRVYEKPAPPLASNAEVCVEVATPVLTAEGNRLRWYADAQKQQLVGEGSSFTPADKHSRSYYVSQSSDYCESQAVEVSFTAKRFDPAKAKIANVVTPNGDTKNQRYYIKDFETQECLGEFHSITIINRWGQTVFESKQADFSWDASSLPSGVYYYHLQYQLQPFYGYLQVIK